jgi:subtilisin family serine protease
METKEYIVVLKEGIDYDSFWNEVEKPTTGLPCIPNRSVAITYNENDQPQICRYALTDQEANQLKQDVRVLAVERPLDQIGLHPGFCEIFGPSTANVSFSIPAITNHSGNNVNWGLIRNSYDNNTYGNTINTSSEYQYTLDGTGVDIVIMDSGIEYYHPEFLDANGNVRVKLYDWTGYIGQQLDTTPNSINFNDINGHGTACAGIAAGLNYGWARNANIYPCKINISGTGPGSINVDKAFDAIKRWHIAKNTPGNVAFTGRPTVVNGSFGYVFSNAELSITSINYQNGGNVPATGPDALKGMTNGSVSQIDLTSGITYSFPCGQPIRTTQIDSRVNSMIAAGVVFVAAAGNDAHKIAAPSDPDYQNYWNGTWNGNVQSLDFRYYNRGASPGTENAIVVGALVAGVRPDGKNQKISYSNAGYNVEVFAVGWNPRTAYSTTNSAGPSGSALYWLNQQGQTFRQRTFGGTSAAAPQIAGIAALYLQTNPTASPTNVKNWLNKNANKEAMYNSGFSTDYTNYQSQWGGNGGVAYQNIQGLTQVKTAANRWQPVKAVFVKDANNQWQPVKNTWANDAGTWKQTYTAP